MKKTVVRPGGVVVRLIEALNGFRTKYGYWPHAIDLPAGTLDAIANYHLTPHGFALVKKRVELRPNDREPMDVVAFGKDDDNFSYGDEGWRTQGQHQHDARAWIGLGPDGCQADCPQQGGASEAKETVGVRRAVVAKKVSKIAGSPITPHAPQMTSRGKTIQIYLQSGDPQGIRQAEITTRLVRLVEVPRALLAEFFSMPESHGGAIYFLFGDAEDAAKPSVYIGQTASLKQRLTDHNKKKDFWHRAVVMLSKGDSFSASQSLYLERLCIQHAKEAGRWVVTNDTKGNTVNSTKQLDAECGDHFHTAQTLMATLGFQLFEKPSKPPGEVALFYCTAAGTDAIAQYVPEGMVVLKGSKARGAVTPNFQAKSGYFDLRARLVAEGVMKTKGNDLVFTQDYLFKTPSAAAAVIVGNSMNGWTTWKNLDGKDLDVVYRAGSKG
jgi:hypothetical protein